MGEKRERGREREGEKEASMVTDSIHLNYSNSVKKPVKKKNKTLNSWTVPSHHQPQLLLTQAHRNLLHGFTAFKPADRTPDHPHGSKRSWETWRSWYWTFVLAALVLFTVPCDDWTEQNGWRMCDWGWEQLVENQKVQCCSSFRLIHTLTQTLVPKQCLLKGFFFKNAPLWVESLGVTVLEGYCQRDDNQQWAQVWWCTSTSQECLG